MPEANFIHKTVLFIHQAKKRYSCIGFERRKFQYEPKLFFIVLDKLRIFSLKSQGISFLIGYSFCYLKEKPIWMYIENQVCRILQGTGKRAICPDVQCRVLENGSQNHIFRRFLPAGIYRIGSAIINTQRTTISVFRYVNIRCIAITKTTTYFMKYIDEEKTVLYNINRFIKYICFS